MARGGKTVKVRHCDDAVYNLYVCVYMNSSNDSPVILYFDTVSTPRDTT